MRHGLVTLLAIAIQVLSWRVHAQQEQAVEQLVYSIGSPTSVHGEDVITVDSSGLVKRVFSQPRRPAVVRTHRVSAESVQMLLQAWHDSSIWSFETQKSNVPMDSTPVVLSIQDDGGGAKSVSLWQLELKEQGGRAYELLAAVVAHVF